MWLTLLLTVFDDAFGMASRKAARHEMKGRLFPVDREPRPAAWQTFFEFFEKLQMGPRPPEVDLALGKALISVNFFVETVWRDAIGGPGSPHFIRSVIEKMYRDRLYSRETTISDRRFSIEPTEFDPLFRAALWEVGEACGWSLYAISRMVNPDSFPNTVSLIYESIPEARDWVQMTHPDLTGMTLAQIVAATDAWHATLQGIGFHDPIPPTLIIAIWPDGWTLQRLTEKKDFANEGMSMAHCIGGPIRARGIRDGESQYWQAARDDQAAYFSLRDPNGIPEMTIEVVSLPSSEKNGKIIQIQGPNDKPPHPAVTHRFTEGITALDGWIFQSQQVRWDPERLPPAPFLGEVEVERMGIRQRLEALLDVLSTATRDWHGQRPQEEATRRLLEAFAAIEAKRKDGYSSGVRPGSAMGSSQSLLTNATGLYRVLGYTLGCRRTGLPVESGLGVGVDKKKGVWLFVWAPNNPSGTSAPWIEGKSSGMRKTKDPIEALRWFLGVSATPPDTSHITPFPGLEPDPSRSLWDRAIEPIAEARAERTLQSYHSD